MITYHVETPWIASIHVILVRDKPSKIRHEFLASGSPQMFSTRQSIYTELEAARSSKVLAFVTGDRPDAGIQIAADVYDHFVDHLDKIGVVNRISLVLYTRGGVTTAASSIINLIKLFCDELEVIVPSRSHSAGTLMALGANKIIMTKQATLGPIDPSVNNSLNPQAANGATVPVGAEAIKGFIELAKEQIGISGQAELGIVFSRLVEKVHPLVLGEVYRARNQIKMLANKLLEGHISEETKRKKIIDFLCSESGSHDYTINRREAKKLGLNIETPSVSLYGTVKKIYDDVVGELMLTTRFDPSIMLGTNVSMNYTLVRGLVESLAHGSTRFESVGTLTRTQVPAGNNATKPQVNDQRTFEGWKHYGP